MIVQTFLEGIRAIIDAMKPMVEDAIVFIVDPEARAISEFKYLNGNPMSVRDARRNGLMRD